MMMMVCNKLKSWCDETRLSQVERRHCKAPSDARENRSQYHPRPYSETVAKTKILSDTTMTNMQSYHINIFKPLVQILVTVIIDSLYNHLKYI